MDRSRACVGIQVVQPSLVASERIFSIYKIFSDIQCGSLHDLNETSDVAVIYR